MKSARFIVATLLCALCISGRVFAQGQSALPFLLIGTAPDQNGMGGVSTCIPSNQAMAPIGNPAQLGMFALSGFVSASLYVPKTDLLPEYNLPTLSFNAMALNVGFNLQGPLGLPLPVSLGVGYSRIYLDLGQFNISSTSGPTVIRTFDSWEKNENLSVGLGVDYFVRFGAGMNFKFISSRLSPIGTEFEHSSGSADVTATDFGLFFQVPTMKIVSTLAGSIEVLPSVEPLLDLSVGYARRNIGDKVVYADPSQADPLPRQAALGVGVQVGLMSHVLSEDWRIFELKLSREADDLLVKRLSDGGWTYVSGLGGVGFLENVIGGKQTGDVIVRRGWEVQAGEILSVRGGSVTQAAYNYSTSGFSIRLDGVLKLLSYAGSPEIRGGFLGFLIDFIDIRYDHASYDQGSPFGGVSFGSISIEIKKMPF